MKTTLYWAVIACLFAAGIASQWLPFNSWLNSLGVVVLIVVICILPGWLMGSSRIVKNAIECAHRANFKGLKALLVSRGWLIFPSPKYNDIVHLLRELAEHPEVKPANGTEFSQYIINDGMGYILSWEGREKMLQRLGTGVFSWRLLENPALLTWLLRLVVILAVIRLFIFLIGDLIRILHH